MFRLQRPPRPPIHPPRHKLTRTIRSPEGPTPTAIISRPAPSPARARTPCLAASLSPGCRESIAVSQAARRESAHHRHTRFGRQRQPAARVSRSFRALRGILSSARDVCQPCAKRRGRHDQAISGEIQSIRTASRAAGPVDVRGLAHVTSDQSRRDAFIRSNTLHTDQYPMAAGFTTAD